MAGPRQRLGEILVREQVITRLQLSDGLKNQVIYGGRLGTNLIELGYASHDQIARALAMLHEVPAALTKHLANSDPAVRALVDAETAREHMALPIARLRNSKQQVAVCFRDPDPERAAAVGAHLGARVVASVASEAAILYWLERSYGVPRPQRYAFSTPGEASPLPRTSDTMRVAVSDLWGDDDGIDIDFDSDVDEPEVLPDQFQLVDLDDVSVEKDTSLYRPGQRQVSALLEIASSSSQVDLAEAAHRAASMAAAAAAGAVAAEPVQRTRANRPTSRPPALDLASALQALGCASDRVAISDALLGYMANQFDGALIIIIKGDLALGHRGFGGNFDHETVESIVVPLGVPSVFKTVNDTLQQYVGPPPENAHAVQRRFFKLFPTTPDQVVLLPISIRGRLVCVAYGHPPQGRPVDPAVLGELDEMRLATEKALLRLIRSAKTKR